MTAASRTQQKWQENRHGEGDYASPGASVPVLHAAKPYHEMPCLPAPCLGY
jgi:hypothetical protein